MVREVFVNEVQGLADCQRQIQGLCFPDEMYCSHRASIANTQTALRCSKHREATAPGVTEYLFGYTKAAPDSETAGKLNSCYTHSRNCGDDMRRTPVFTVTLISGVYVDVRSLARTTRCYGGRYCGRGDAT